MTNGIETVPCNPLNNYNLHYIDGVVYAKRETRDLKMRILTPHRVPRAPMPENGFSRDDMDEAFGPNRTPPRGQLPERKPLPALITMTGTGFGGAEGQTGVVTYAEIARSGCVVAGIDYRGAQRDDTRFPDCVQDAKEAVRFLRAHAGESGIDPNRIAMLGSSSAGWLTMMAAVTGDDPAFTLGENREYSDALSAAVDLFGPMDFELIVPDRIEAGRRMGQFTHEGYSLFRNDVVKDPTLLHQASVLRRITAEQNIPPVLIIHGTEDPTIPIKQSHRLYEALDQAGKSVQMCVVEGAGHETYIWGPETMRRVVGFLHEVMD